MRRKLRTNFVRAALLVACGLFPLLGQDSAQSTDFPTLLAQGSDALKANHFVEAARAFQRAVDLNPSSVRAHEGLGIALFRELSTGNTRPSAGDDMAERAETHLKQAAELSPSTIAPRFELSGREAWLGERTQEADERTQRYRKAEDLLKQCISLEPGRAEMYLHLAGVERDEFGPAIRQAAARFAKTAGPIPDADVRRSLQQQYAAVVNDAISNARRASEMNGSAQRPLLLLSQLLRERAVIRDTQDQYAADMSSAADYRRQFLAEGGHVSDEADAQH